MTTMPCASPTTACTGSPVASSPDRWSVRWRSPSGCAPGPSRSTGACRSVRRTCRSGDTSTAESAARTDSPASTSTSRPSPWRGRRRTRPRRRALSGHDPVLRQHGYHPLRIARVVAETHDASSFVLDVPDELAETFRYQPGQFCTFRVHVEGEEQLRSYSMSSAPATDGELTVTVKRVAGGLVSNWFLDNLSEGDTIELTKPAGVFCPQDSEGPGVGFCGGGGIPPGTSLAKHVPATTDRPVRLLYANRDRNSVIFDTALGALGAAHPGRLQVRHHFDADDGFLTTDAIAQFVAADVDADIYICGPGPFMDLVESTVQAQGVVAERIFIERFLVEQAEKTDALIDDEAAGADGAVVPDEVTVTLGGRTVV